MAHHIRHFLNSALRFNQQLSWRTGSASSERSSSTHQLGILNAFPYQAVTFGFSSTQYLAEQHRGHRRLSADESGHHPRMPTARMKTYLHKPCVELGTLSSQSHITAQSEIHPRTYCSSTDRGNGREWAASHAQETLVDRFQRVSGRLRKVAQVCASTERGRCPRDDDGVHRFVGLEAIHGRTDFRDHVGGQSVSFAWVVQRDGRNARVNIHEYKRHAITVPWSPMLDHVFLDAISAVRDAFGNAFLERQAFEERFQSDMLLGDLVWETSYGLPGEGSPPRALAHVTFNWPSWSQALYRHWYVEGEFDQSPVIDVEVVFRLQRLLAQPDPHIVSGVATPESPSIGSTAFRRNDVTVEICHVPDVPVEYALEVTYEGSYELAEETLQDGASKVLDEHFGVLGAWVASTLVRLGDLGLQFREPDSP